MSRRDDVIQVAYTLIFMCDFNRDWIKYIRKANNPYHFVRDYKLNTSAAELCRGKNTEIFTALLEEAYSYEYDQEPNYDRLRWIMQDYILREGFLPDR